jgi:DNA mismatch repair protein MutS2
VLTSRDEVILEYDKVAEMIQVLVSLGELPSDGIKDIEELVERVSVPNSYLQPPEFIRIFNLLSAAMNIRSFFEDCKETYPRLYELTRMLVPLPSFKRMVRDTFDAEGEVRDDATEELKDIRRRKNELAKRIEGTLEKYLYDPAKALLLQEQFITERNYRKVLPVKVEFKHKIRGIIHAYSITEETAFIEPMEVVEMSNELTDIIVEEEKEIRRILTEVADLLREKLNPLRLNLDIVAEIDCIHAKAGYARKRNCNVPRINDTGEIVIEEARHPLLMESIGEKDVPLTLNLGPKDRALVISGPNAGGKTTAVKTVGMLALMAQSAIPVPAKQTSSFPVFTDFFADIGDDQSITQGISTFSSHIQQIKAIIENAPQGSLIILDELGTGTDPAEGALLAQAILEDLAQRLTTTLVTSHLTSLKTLDRTREWARTASFSLDPDTEAPNFQLAMDVAGDSNALKIARLLGLPKSVVDRAYELMSPDERQLKNVLELVKKEQSKFEQLRREAEKERKDVAKSRARYYKLIDELETEKSKAKDSRLKHQKEAALEKKRVVAQARKHIENLIANLHSKADVLSAKQGIVREQQKVDDEIADIDRKLARRTRKPGKPVRFDDLKAGMTVYVDSLNSLGTVKRTYDSRKTVDVTVDDIDFNVGIKNVYFPGKHPEEHPVREVHARQVTPRKAFTSNELNLIGKTVEAALEDLDRFIDSALLSGFDTIRVIHGLGTGALRKAVRSHLKSHPRIQSYGDPEERPGDKAVTVADII